MNNIENKPIVAGDVVTLKSGGTPMTVEGMESPPNHLSSRQLPGTQMARCVWMDESGAVGERLIWPHLLVVKVPDPAYPQIGARSLRQYDNNSVDPRTAPIENRDAEPREEQLIAENVDTEASLAD